MSEMARAASASRLTTNTRGRGPKRVKPGRFLPLAPPWTLDYPRRTLQPRGHSTPARRQAMATNSVYRVTDLVGTSRVSWEDAVKNAVQTAGKTLRELRVGEVSRLPQAHHKGKRHTSPPSRDVVGV